MKNLLPISIIAVAVAGGAGFYGGMQYGQNHPSADLLQAGDGGRNFQNLSAEERQQRISQFGAGGRQRGGQGGNLVGGEIIAKDDTSITIKSNDGGSRIVFFSDSTKVTKSAAGSSGDIAIGAQALVNGTPNQDGSISAETIQLRPDMPRPPQANGGK